MRCRKSGISALQISSVHSQAVTERIQQILYVSDLTVNPDHWNPKKEEIKAKALVHPTEKAAHIIL